MEIEIAESVKQFLGRINEYTLLDELLTMVKEYELPINVEGVITEVIPLGRKLYFHLVLSEYLHLAELSYYNNHLAINYTGHPTRDLLIPELIVLNGDEIKSSNKSLAELFGLTSDEKI